MGENVFGCRRDSGGNCPEHRIQSFGGEPFWAPGDQGLPCGEVKVPEQKSEKPDCCGCYSIADWSRQDLVLALMQADGVCVVWGLVMT